jgi:hypothetical protein
MARELHRTPLAVFTRGKALGLTGVPQGYELLTHAAERTGFGHATLRQILRWAHVRIRYAICYPTKSKKLRSHKIVDSYDTNIAVKEWLKTESASRVAERLGVCRRTAARRLRRAGYTTTPGQYRVTEAEVKRAMGGA